MPEEVNWKEKGRFGSGFLMWSFGFFPSSCVEWESIMEDGACIRTSLSLQLEWEAQRKGERGERQRQGENMNPELKLQLRNQKFHCNLFPKTHILFYIGSLCLFFFWNGLVMWTYFSSVDHMISDDSESVLLDSVVTGLRCTANVNVQCMLKRSNVKDLISNLYIDYSLKWHYFD